MCTHVRTHAYRHRTQGRRLWCNFPSTCRYMGCRAPASPTCKATGAPIHSALYTTTPCAHRAWVHACILAWVLLRAHPCAHWCVCGVLSGVHACARAHVQMCVHAYVRACALSFTLSCVLSCARTLAVVPAIVRPIMLSCCRAIARSWYSAIMLSCYRAIMLSCYRAIVRALGD